MEQSVTERCQELLGYRFRDIKLLEKALTHASVAPTRLESNERLEFLGDAVLDVVICSKLYHDHTKCLEGQLTRIKSAVVSGHACAEVASELGLPELLMLGKGLGGPALPESLVADVLESVIGAIYVDGGLEPASQFILRSMTAKIEQVIANQHARNYKSILQQYAQREWNCTPDYELLDEQGPDHAKAFEICVFCNGRRFQSAWGSNKKETEQLAARAALEDMDLIAPSTEHEKQAQTGS